MAKKILITGSRGFIGSHLTDFLIQKSYEVKSLDRDIKESLELDYKPDIFIHLAAKSRGNYEEIWKNNVNGTLNVLKFCKNKNIKFIFSSTVGVYGEPQYLPVNENHPIKPINIYSKSKAEAEKICKKFSDKYNLNTVILRLTNIYGSGQKKGPLIPHILDGIKNNNIITLSDPEMRRDFVYIDDLMKAFLRAISYKNSLFEVFNIGSGVGYSINEVVEIFSNLLNRKIKVDYQGARSDEIKKIIVNSDKAKSILHWDNKTSLEDGISYLLTK